jgi:hypothetical protein
MKLSVSFTLSIFEPAIASASRRLVVCAAATFALGVGMAQANILVNGSFESAAVPVGSGTSFAVGSNGIPGWTVVGPAGTGVAIVSGTFTDSGIKFPAEDGSQWLDLTGVSSNNLEGVSQTAPTVAGTTYTLTFWVGNITGLGGIYSSVGLKINGTPAGNYTNFTPGTAMNWQKFSYSFIATSSTTAIEFDNLDPIDDDSNGLDNVDLEVGGTAAPLPVNLLTNGDFEEPVIDAGSVLNVSTGSTALTGWTVIGTAPFTVALVSGACICGAFNTTGLTFPAEDGHQALDLTGTGFSTGTRGITQTVPTIAGTSYLLTFWVGNIFDPNAVSNPGCCNFGTTSTVGLKINGTEAGSFTNSAQASIENWQQVSVNFTAVGNSTVIEFDNLDPPTDSSNGLDNVVLQEDPYPAFFNGQASLGNGVYYLQFPNGNLFGYYNLTNFPIFYHYDMGFEALIDGGNGAAYMYDFASGHWWYTTASLFPYLYDFTLNTFIYYFPSTTSPGHYTTNPRYFSNLTTDTIFTM